MNIRHCLPKCIAITAVVVLAATSSCFGAVLSVPQYNQEKNQWCWNASSQMVLAFAGHSYSQTEIANWAVGGQNIANYLYGSTDSSMHGCDEVLSHFGSISSTGSASAMLLNALANEMANSRPVVIRWGWDSGGGHILVVRGTDGDSVYLNDPWPDHGQSVNSYNWVYQADSHTWTHTLKLSSGGDTTYYQYYLYYYNFFQQCFSQYQATGSYYYLAYTYYYYAYTAYCYYMYYGDSSSANAYYNYYIYYAQYYYELYRNQAYSQYLTYYSYTSYYYSYYQQTGSYLALAYAYYYYAYTAYCYYMYYGDSSSASTYYNYYMYWAYYIYDNYC